MMSWTNLVLFLQLDRFPLVGVGFGCASPPVMRVLLSYLRGRPISCFPREEFLDSLVWSGGF